MCGLAENGIYSVGYKIPSILSVFQTIFNQAWTLSAVKEFESDNYDLFLSKTYAIYNFYMTVVCSAIIVMDKPIAKILYANEFFEAWKYVPFLLMSIVFGAMSGHLGGVFAAVKDSKAYATTTVIGAGINIVLNFALIYCFGTIGAAIATLVSYIAVWLLRIYYAKKYVNLTVNLFKSSCAYFVLLIQSIILFIVKNAWLEYSLEVALLITVILIFKKEFLYCKNLISRIIKK